MQEQQQQAYYILLKTTEMNQHLCYESLFGWMDLLLLLYIFNAGKFVADTGTYIKKNLSQFRLIANAVDYTGVVCILSYCNITQSFV